MSQTKGFALSIEAVACLLVLITFTASMEANRTKEKTSLKEELAYQQVQDMVEVCLKKEEQIECFSQINRVNPLLETDSNGTIKVTRRIDGREREITFNFALGKE